MDAKTTAPRPLVLIVDDDHDIRETLAEALTLRGFTTVTAANGLEALRLLQGLDQTQRPSLILLDLMMPVLDGYGFLDLQRRDPALATIPVAIITASHGMDPGRLGSLAPPLFRKPIRLAQLMEAIRDLTRAPP